MNDASAQDRHAAWQAHIDAYRTSGLSGRRFCQAHDLIYHQFVYWRKKLAGTERVPPRGNLVAVNGFTQVVLERPANAELTIQLPTGLSIQGIRHQNLDLLQALLERL